MARETRLLDKSTFDDPNESCLAGSSEEFDMLMDWSREDLVSLIQSLDNKLFNSQARKNKLKAIMLLVDPSFRDVEMNVLTSRQWAEYIKAFPEERVGINK